MKELSQQQKEFLKEEFGIINIDYKNSRLLEEIRLKCFDIETEETEKQLENGADEMSIGERGDMAVTIIDDLFEIINGKAV